MNIIPNINDPERYALAEFINANFVELVNDEVTNEYIIIDMQYPKLKMKHAESKCFVRAEVYSMLFDAAKSLPKGYKLKVWDAWRPFALQDELYDEYSEEIIKEFNLENSSEEEKAKFIQKFVSDPLWDKDVPPVHTTGGAVDVTILDDKGNELDMGTKFDAFTDKTHTAYFEQEENANQDYSNLKNGNQENANQDNNAARIRENRRLLYMVMTKAGFTNLPSEWWHYDYGDRFWAYYNGKPALYRGVFTREEING